MQLNASAALNREGMGMTSSVILRPAFEIALPTESIIARCPGRRARLFNGPPRRVPSPLPAAWRAVEKPPGVPRAATSDEGDMRDAI